MLYFVILAFVGLCHVSEGSVQRYYAATTQSPSPQSKTNTASINDTDYWDSDDFVPFRDNQHDLFDWRFMKEIILSDSKNIIISPFSIKLILALLSEGAGADTVTKKELSAILPNAGSPALVKEIYSKALESLNEPNNNYELHIGTKMFIDHLLEPRQRFAAIAQTSYGTSVERMEFKNSANAVQNINKWCSNITEGHIPLLVTKNEIESAVMVIVNAIFFDGVWRNPFLEKDSFNSVFYKTPHQGIQTKYMTQEGRFYFFESSKLDAKIIRLPYKGRKFSMTIILPRSKGGLDELIRELDGDTLKRLHWFMEEVQVKVTIPCFQFDYSSQLKNHLVNLGIREIFSSNASLPGIARGAGANNQLIVSKIVQKCGLIVNEKGTTAFGATDVAFGNKFGGDTNTFEFDANRPFMFIIEDESKGTIIFTGKVTDPTRH